MKPTYRDGDVIVVSPGTPIRRGDRVVLKTSDGEVMVKELKRRTTRTLPELLNGCPCHDRIHILERHHESMCRRLKQGRNTW